MTHDAAATLTLLLILGLAALVAFGAGWNKGRAYERQQAARARKATVLARARDTTQQRP